MALDQQGTVINLAKKIPRQRLMELKQSSFYCPQCRQRVMLKAGTMKIPHFAHRPSSSCRSFSENESERHLKGKADLYRWLSRFGEAQLEAFLPEICQRPDLLAKGKVAVEFQCSSISSDVFSARTQGYQRHQYVPFWIYGGAPVVRYGEFFRFTAFQRLFFQYTPAFGFWFLAYCPKREEFTFYSHLTPYSTSLYLASVQVMPRRHASFPPSFSPHAAPPAFSLSHWLKQKNAWIQKQLYYKQGIQHPLMKAVYQMGGNPFLLPEWLGVPVRYMALLKNHPLEWQFYLWKELFLHTLEPSTEQAVTVLEKQISKGRLELNTFPLISPLRLHHLAEAYINLWKTAGHRSLKGAAHMYEQMKREKRLAEVYGEMIRNQLFL